MRDLTKRYGGDIAVDRLSLEIGEAEFFSILGPSGCGKTTTLRMLGGFVIPDSGQLLLSGRDATGIPPYRRDVNTVFQSYALFSHLNVAENIAFGLRRRRVPRPEISRRIGEMLELVGLSSRARARPSELSGGQQQRVALARALVNMPAVLLLDEPLGALDRKLRREMQIELKAIQREVGITFVFVTHDQEEALTMSDRIAVMDAGRLQQVGAAVDVYDRPANAFVAGFIGASNILPGELQADGVLLAGGARMGLGASLTGVMSAGDAVVVSVRPEKVIVDGPLGDGCVRLTAEVVDVVYLGATTHITLAVGPELRIVATAFHAGGRDGSSIARGDSVQVGWRPDDALILDDTRGGAGPAQPSVQ